MFKTHLRQQFHICSTCFVLGIDIKCLLLLVVVSGPRLFKSTEGFPVVITTQCSVVRASDHMAEVTVNYIT